MRATDKKCSRSFQSQAAAWDLFVSVPESHSKSLPHGKQRNQLETKKSTRGLKQPASNPGPQYHAYPGGRARGDDVGESLLSLIGPGYPKQCHQRDRQRASTLCLTAADPTQKYTNEAPTHTQHRQRSVPLIRLYSSRSGGTRTNFCMYSGRYRVHRFAALFQKRWHTSRTVTNLCHTLDPRNNLRPLLTSFLIFDSTLTS